MHLQYNINTNTNKCTQIDNITPSKQHNVYINSKIYNFASFIVSYLQTIVTYASTLFIIDAILSILTINITVYWTIQIIFVFDYYNIIIY